MGQRDGLGFFPCRRQDLERCVETVRERIRSRPHSRYGASSALWPHAININTVVISLQGLLGAYLPTFFGALSPLEVWRSHRLIEARDDAWLFWLRHGFVRGARQEREI